MHAQQTVVIQPLEHASIPQSAVTMVSAVHWIYVTQLMDVDILLKVVVTMTHVPPNTVICQQVVCLHLLFAKLLMLVIQLIVTHYLDVCTLLCVVVTMMLVQLTRVILHWDVSMMNSTVTMMTHVLHTIVIQLLDAHILI